MNPYIVPVKCSVCGGEGMAASGRGHPWYDDFTHNDPAVCTANLKAAELKREKEEKEEQKRLNNFFEG